MWTGLPLRYCRICLRRSNRVHPYAVRTISVLILSTRKAHYPSHDADSAQEAAIPSLYPRQHRRRIVRQDS